MATHFTIEDGTATPDFPGLMLATIITLKDINRVATVPEIVARLIEIERVTNAEQSYKMPNGKNTKLRHYLGWARSYLNHTGALDKVAYGIWALTDAGREIKTMKHARDAHDKYRAQITQRNTQEQAGEEEPVIEAEISPDEAAWKEPLLGILTNMPYDAFERLCHRLLETLGFTDVEVLGKVADGGVDGVGFLHENLLSRKIYFQCKCWRYNVGSPQIRNFRGALDGRSNQGLFITTSRFTAPAKDEAIRDGSILIDLIDGNRLCDLIKEKNLGVVIYPNGQLVPIKDFFDNI